MFYEKGLIEEAEYLIHKSAEVKYGKVEPYEWIKRDFIGDLLIGGCPNCGAEVRYHSKGFDEECHECGCGLNWETFEEDFKEKYGGLK